MAGKGPPFASVAGLVICRRMMLSLTTSLFAGDIVVALVWISGGGLIGAGWAAAFCAAGHRVLVIDPDISGARARVDAVLARVAGVIGLPGDHIAPEIAATAEDLPAALRSPALVQECLPERLELKRAALAALEPLLPDETLIASSSSGLSPDEIAAGLALPGRVFIAHP